MPPKKKLEKKLSSGSSSDDQTPGIPPSRYLPAKRRACSESPKSKRRFLPHVFRTRESRPSTSDTSSASARSKSEGYKHAISADEGSSGTGFGALLDLAAKEVGRAHRSKATTESAKEERSGKPSGIAPNIARCMKNATSKIFNKFMHKALPEGAACGERITLATPSSTHGMKRSKSYRKDSKHIDEDTFQTILNWAPQDTNFDKATRSETGMLTESTSLVDDTDSRHSSTSSAQEQMGSVSLDAGPRVESIVLADNVSENFANFDQQQSSSIQEDVAGESMDVEDGDLAIAKVTEVSTTLLDVESEETICQSKRKRSVDDEK